MVLHDQSEVGLWHNRGAYKAEHPKTVFLIKEFQPTKGFFN